MNKKHYHIVAGEVHFRNKENEIGSIRLNTMLTSYKQAVTLADIAKAQQTLQLHFHKRIDDLTLEIYDVFIMSVSYLGKMTEEEFKKPLDGTEMVERDSDKHKNVLSKKASVNPFEVKKND